MGRIACALGIYGCVSLLLFGRDVVGDPGGRVVGDASADKTLYMWSFEWWPHALGHLRNPLHVDIAWVPHGYDFGLGTAGGGLALAAVPLTSAVGPVITYNVLILAAPALAATTAFVLAQRVTRSFAPSLVAGFVYGFSSYETGRMLGHLPLAFTVLVPLVPYLILRRHEGALSRRAFVGLLAAVLVGEFLIVTQIFFTLVLLAVAGAAVAVLVHGAPAVRRTIGETAAAVLVAIVLLSPILAFALLSNAVAPPREPFWNASDVLNYVVPTRRTWLRPPGTAGIADRFTGSKAEQGAYLGLPFLLLIALAALRRPRTPSRLTLTLVFLAAAVLRSAPGSRSRARSSWSGPWSVLAPLPVAGSATPARLTMYTAMFGGLLAALALTDRTNVFRWSLAVIGIVATLPNFHLPSWTADVQRPAFFASGCDARYLPPGSTALVFPYGPAGWSMLWQGESGFRYRLVGGHFAVRIVPGEGGWEDVYKGLLYGGVSPRRFRSFLNAHGVDVVVVAPGTSGRVRREIQAAIAEPPVQVLDSLVYELRMTGNRRDGRMRESPTGGAPGESIDKAAGVGFG